LISGISINPINTAGDSTVEFQVIQLNATQQAIEYQEYQSVNSSFTSAIAPIGTTILSNSGVTVYLNPSFGAADVGATSFIKVLQSVASNSNPNGPAFQFQAGANEGATIAVDLVSVSTSSLRISNINLATSQIVNGNPSAAIAVLGAQDAIGQIDQAITQVNDARAALGAVIGRLQNAANNNNIASANLTSSASAITDLNVGQATSEYNRDQILVQVGTAVLSQSNTNAQTVLGLFR
jgi:flagellin